jgi:hypothetical protein
LKAPSQAAGEFARPLEASDLGRGVCGACAGAVQAKCTSERNFGRELWIRVGEDVFSR